MLVVGSFASGGDIARLMAVWNMNKSRASPWNDHAPPPAGVRDASAISSSKISFADGSCLEDVDAILFATGYVFALPFCKRSDAPWRDDVKDHQEILSGVLGEEEKGELGQWETGGLKGQGMRTEGMDELLMFRRGDRSLVFPGLGTSLHPITIPPQAPYARLLG